MNSGPTVEPTPVRPPDGHELADAVIVGGGFYGCEIALELRRLGLERVVVVEREAGILRRASYVNQARVHNGYHYPRSMLTAIRSRENFERFVQDYAYAVDQGLTKIYAIARASKVSASQFEQFCRRIGASCRIASQRVSGLFDPSLIDASFEVREFAFDAKAIADVLLSRLKAGTIDLRCNCEASIGDIGDSRVTVNTSAGVIRSSWVFNCTYAELDRCGVDLGTRIKRELAEIVLIEPPPELKGLGITVMDGPYFSTMPFPAAKLHSLSHVRYTPHQSWHRHWPEQIRMRSHCASMMRDSQRYLPLLSKARVVRSIYDIKAVLVDNEDNDGRPILVERHHDQPRIISVLGAKIDNIYDMKHYLRNRPWSSFRPRWN